MNLYHSVMATVHMPPVSKKAILQPHTPGQASTKADTTMGPTIPATAPIVLAGEEKEGKKHKRLEQCAMYDTARHATPPKTHTKQ